ncbi:MAG: bifunctional heptose 7-phosphate kinase/heptose 1-phosphate adenyltransferase [Thermoguttaceae bacterium]
MNGYAVQQILAKLPNIRIAVVGDFFLDRYWNIVAELDEVSIETGLTAYQVASCKMSAGAAGTVTNNLAALDVGKVYAIGFVGNDGEGFELTRALASTGIDLTFLHATPERATPCYTKPMRGVAGMRGVEQNRFDIKNRVPTPREVEAKIIDAIHAVAPLVDAVMVMDQVSEDDCGVVTTAVRDELQRQQCAIIYADSRTRIGLFRNVLIKCNEYEVAAALGCDTDSASLSIEQLARYGKSLAATTGRAVFVTLGERGQLVVDVSGETTLVDAVHVSGPIDICGAGDATSAALVASLCAGATLCEAARIGNVAASITIRQIGQTGTASRKQILDVFERETSESEHEA